MVIGKLSPLYNANAWWFSQTTLHNPHSNHISQTDNAMLGNVPCHEKTRDLTTPCTKCCACHVKHDPVSPHQHTSCKTHNGTELSRQLRDGGEQRRTQLNPHTPLNTHSEEITASVLQLWPQFFKEEVKIFLGCFSSFGILFVVQSRSLRSNLWKKRSQPTAFSHHISFGTRWFACIQCSWLWWCTLHKVPGKCSFTFDNTGYLLRYFRKNQLYFVVYFHKKCRLFFGSISDLGAWNWWRLVEKVVSRLFSQKSQIVCTFDRPWNCGTMKDTFAFQSKSRNRTKKLKNGFVKRFRGRMVS